MLVLLSPTFYHLCWLRVSNHCFELFHFISNCVRSFCYFRLITEKNAHTSMWWHHQRCCHRCYCCCCHLIAIVIICRHWLWFFLFWIIISFAREREWKGEHWRCPFSYRNSLIRLRTKTSSSSSSSAIPFSVIFVYNCKVITVCVCVCVCLLYQRLAILDANAKHLIQK